MTPPLGLIEGFYGRPWRWGERRSAVTTLAAHGYAMPRLSFATLRGFLKGFIDLVFEHEGRFFILDWKSNHLGDTPARYGQDAMAAAMRDQGYHLQYLLYLVALDRYLRQRVVDYDPERHLGGAVYLFYEASQPELVPNIVRKASEALAEGGFRVSVTDQKAPPVVAIIGRR